MFIFRSGQKEKQQQQRVKRNGPPASLILKQVASEKEAK